MKVANSGDKPRAAGSSMLVEKKIAGSGTISLLLADDVRILLHLILGCLNGNSGILTFKEDLQVHSLGLRRKSNELVAQKMGINF